MTLQIYAAPDFGQYLLERRVTTGMFRLKNE